LIEVFVRTVLWFRVFPCHFHTGADAPVRLAVRSDSKKPPGVRPTDAVSTYASCQLDASRQPRLQHFLTNRPEKQDRRWVLEGVIEAGDQLLPTSVAEAAVCDPVQRDL